MVTATSLTALRAMSAARSAGPSTIAAASRFISTSSPVAANKKSKSKSKAKAKVKVENPDALPVAEAVRVLRALEVANPASAFSIEVLATLQPGAVLRGRVSLPIDPRKEADTIVVFVDPGSPAAKAALEAGAHHVGNEDLFPKILSGEIVPTKCLATSGALGGVTRNLARFLGPKGIMPAAKRGTVADGAELGDLVRNMAGTMEWKADKQGYIRSPVARMSFGAPSIADNIRAFVESIKETVFDAATMDSAHTSISRSGGILHVRLETTHGPSIELKDV